MKMVVAYIDNDKFDGIRTALLGLGFQSLSAWEATGTLPESTVHGQYRGVAIERHVRAKTRFECVTGEEHVKTVVDTVLDLGGGAHVRLRHARRAGLPDDEREGD